MADIKPLVITYNCGRELVKPAAFSNHIVAEFPLISPEIVVVALEEVAPLAYSFLGGSFLASYLDRIQRTIELTARKWGDYHYESVLTRNVGMTALMVFARSDFKGLIVQVESGGVGVGYQEMGNKGAVAVRLGIRNIKGDAAAFTFVAAHLAPMEGAVQRRNVDWKQIVRRLELFPVPQSAWKTSHSSKTERARRLAATDDDDDDDDDDDVKVFMSRGLYSEYDVNGSRSTCGSHLIVAGDLNYRTADSPPRPYARAGFPQLSADPDSPHHHSKLLPSDQLSHEIAAGRVLHGLTEADITFPPTYKYSNAAQREMAILEDDDLKPGARRDEVGDIGTSSPSLSLDFPWAGHRWPSWCDRILWLPTGTEDETKALKYTSLRLMSTSDHQPVALHLSIPWNPSRLHDRPVLSRSLSYELELELGQIPRKAINNDPRNWRSNPPYGPDPESLHRRQAARRKELAAGAVVFMVTTAEGRAMLAAMLVGAVGGWMLIVRLL